MRYDRIVISSGHSLIVRGASGYLDEVTEARILVEELATTLRKRGVDVKTFHDDTSTTQNENLSTIVSWHNAQYRDLDVSCHMNAYVETPKPMGCEVLYLTQKELAGQVSAAISSCGFINRGPKKRTDLAFLNGTEEPAILLETCFVDSQADADLYANAIEDIVAAIAGVLSGEKASAPVEEIVGLRGKVSWFGGPNDKGVAPDEGLAFIDDTDDAPHLFLPAQPPGTSGLARRLDPHAHYIATRWDYDVTSRDMLLEEVALVRAIKTGRASDCLSRRLGTA